MSRVEEVVVCMAVLFAKSHAGGPDIDNNERYEDSYNSEIVSILKLLGRYEKVAATSEFAPE